ncbi:hypothetical protein BASA62_001161 [Batrachochytrium salamandrivorans]|nr:hypothetical protein BASA62_001161 [Batrachochytrium salamandrivorans]
MRVGKGRFQNPFKKSGGGSKSRVTLELTENEEGTSKDLDLLNKDKICGDIKAKVYDLYRNIKCRNDLFRYQMPLLCMVMEDRGVGNARNYVRVKKDDDDKDSESKIKRVEDWFRLHLEDKLKVEKMGENLTDLLKEHFVEWARFLATGCSTDGAEWLSPEKILKDMPFVRWHYETTQAQDTNESDLGIHDK